MQRQPFRSDPEGRPDFPRKFVLLSALLGLLASAVQVCGAADLSAAASAAVLADLLRQVAGGDVEVIALFPPGEHPRIAELPRETAEKAVGVDLYVRVGRGLEGRADRELLGRGPAGPRILDLSEGTDLLGETPAEEAERKIYSAALGIDGTPPGGSPFFWLDPLEASRIVDRMADALAGLLPGGTKGFRARATLLKERIAVLDSEIRRSLPKGAVAPFVTFSGAWGYFARRYGLKVVPAAGLTPGGGPGRHSLAGASARIRALGAGAVFTDLTFPHRPAKEAAAAAGARLIVLEPFGAPGREGYLDMMRRNLELIRGGLAGP